jgi:hypothetical protein
VARVAGRLARAGAFRWPAGPVEAWPAAERDRLALLMAAGGGLCLVDTARLTDADLKWLAAWDGDDAGGEALDAGGVGPGGAPCARPRP